METNSGKMKKQDEATSGPTQPKSPKTGVHRNEHSCNEGHPGQFVQFIPIVVSETQQTNHAGQTVCKVVGCSRANFANGFCRYHHGLFTQGPSIVQGAESDRDSAESWTCACGQKILATKKRCWSCFKWRGGVKGSSKSENACLGDAHLPKPKKSRLQKSKVASNTASMRKHHNKEIHTKRADRCKDSSHFRSCGISSVNSSTRFHLDIKKVRTAKECAERWRAILMMRNQRKALANTNKYDAGATDRFDCSDLIVAPNIELLEREVAKATQRWKDLDSRVVLEEDGSSGCCGGIPTENPFTVDKTLVGDGRRQRLLPLNFDYKCETLPGVDTVKGSASDLVNEEHEQQDFYRPRVLSLLDPTQTLDYENELWHVFHSMPTASELERRYALRGSQYENQEVAVRPLGSLQVKMELDRLLPKHTRMDAYSLGRMRVRNRHSTPIHSISQFRTDESCLMVLSQDYQTKSCLETSIRFEILRHSVNLKRGSGHDSNRLEVELSGSRHTLLDLHRLLVECACTAEGKSVAYKQESKQIDDSALSGVFFIENIFYTHGVIGEYVGRSIMQWLNGHQTNEVTNKLGSQATVSSRRNHLCLFSPNDSMPMSTTYLESLPLRLGVRYVHMFIDHSSLKSHKPNFCSESTLFVTDIHTRPSLSSCYPENHDFLNNAPIIHDAWTSLKQTASCSACNSTSGTVVTMNDELTDISVTLTSANIVRKPSTSNQVEFQGVLLCAACFRDLHYVKSVGQNVLHLRPSHMRFRALPVDVFNKLSFAKATDNIPQNAIF